MKGPSATSRHHPGVSYLQLSISRQIFSRTREQQPFRIVYPPPSSIKKRCTQDRDATFLIGAAPKKEQSGAGRFTSRPTRQRCRQQCLP
jgi:hypothetical protein